MTQQTKHTSGPWHVIADPAWAGKHPCHDARFIATSNDIEVTQHGDDNDSWRFANYEDSIICTMPDAENQKANARLIAAAPELLVELQGALEALLVVGGYPELCQKIDATITKATQQ